MPKIRKPWVSWEEFYLIAGGDWTPGGHTHIASDICGLTQGSVPFASAGGCLAQDNANLFWDATNLRLGLGTALPQNRFHLYDAIADLSMRLSAKEKPWIQWECLDETDGFAFGIEQDDGAVKLFRINYDDPIGTMRITFFELDAKNSRIGVLMTGATYPLDIGGNTRIDATLLTTGAVTFDSTLGVAGLLSNTGGAKLEIQGAVDGGSTRGIFMWDTTSTNWGIYMSQSGAGKSLADGVACTDLAGATGHHFRFRIADTADRSFVWENSSEACLMHLEGSTGNLTLLGNFTVGNEALHILDTGSDHYLIIKPNEDLSANRILSIVTGDAARTITLSGNPTLGDWFDQAVKVASEPSFAQITVGNEGLNIKDTGGDHNLVIKPGSDLGANRILTITTGDAARTITLSGNPTLNDWFDQAVKQASSPSFAGVYIKSSGELRFYDNGNYVGFEAGALDANQIWILPLEDGDEDDFLQTDGAGNLAWAAAGSGDVTAAAVLVDHSLIRGDGGAKGIQDSGILIDDNDVMTFPDGGSISLQEDIAFTGATTENKILIPDNLADALTIAEAGNAYITFVTTDNLESVFLKKDLMTDRWLNSTNNFFLGWQVAGVGNLAIDGGGDKGLHNVGLGYRALYNITTGYRNVAIGSVALDALTTGLGNMAIGMESLSAVNIGQYNVAMGYQAGLRVTSGGDNVAVGRGTLFTCTTTSNNVAVGATALYSVTGSNNIGIGKSAGSSLGGGSHNVLIGYEAGKSSGSSVYHYSIYIGYQSGMDTTTGLGNVGIGYRSIYENRTGGYNVVLGHEAGKGVPGNSYSNNVFIGYRAGYDVTTGSTNVIVGRQAGQDITTGSGNVIIGYQAGLGQVTTDNNELWIANSNTATPLIYGEFPNTLLRVQATGFELIGTAKLGDGGTTDYANVAADGTITLLGTAKVTKKVFLSNAAFTKGGTAPVQVILGNLNGWEFDIGDDAVMTSILPDDWDPTTDITIKVCWYIDEAYAVDKEIQWRVDWSALPHDFSEAVDAPTHSDQIDSGDIDIPAVAKRMGTSTVGTIVAASLSAGDMLGFKLSRIDVTEDDPTAKPTAHHLIIEYTADRIGT